MESIYHEKQDGQLCAQHCLNNLLQARHFTAVDLSRIAEALDQEEAATLAEGGLDSPHLARFTSQPSPNMDDTGFFSVQVISRALTVWNLNMTLWNAPHNKHVMDNPIAQKAFICNHDSHWLTIRKLGKQWFDLNSLLSKPELISDTYLSLFLTQLQMEGYSIFVVDGSLPRCEADELLTLIPIEPQHSSRRSTQPTQHPMTADERYDAELAAAMSASLSEGEHNWEDTELAAAISMSMQGESDENKMSSSEGQLKELSQDEMRQKRLKHLGCTD